MKDIRTFRLEAADKINNLPEDTNASLLGKEDKTNKWQANGYASLWGDGKVPVSQLPPAFIGGDMTKTVYDPQNINSDAFSRVNHTGQQSADTIIDWVTNKVFSSVEKNKLAWIEPGAEVNNISDVNAADLTDWGDTTLHNHNSTYYTKWEVNSLVSNVWVNLFTLSETIVLNGNTYQQSCTLQSDARYSTTPTEITWPTVTWTAIAWGKAVSDAWVITGIPAWPITTHLKVRKISGNADFTFYYEYYKLNTTTWTETLLWTSSVSDQVHSNVTSEFLVSTILPATILASDERLMRKGFFNKVGWGTDPLVWISVEWTDPTYVSLALPITSVSQKHNDTTEKQWGTSWEYYHLTNAEHASATRNASSTQNWLLSSADWNTFNWKQNALWFTPANSATNLTINGVTYDLSTNRSWTVSWWSWRTKLFDLAFSWEFAWGSLVPKTPAPWAWTFNSLTISSDTLPNGSNITVDVRKNGTSILSAPLSITTTETATNSIYTATTWDAGKATITTTTFSAKDRLEVIWVAGSTLPWTNVTVQLIATLT